MDARSIALLEFPAVRSRLAEKTSFEPSRRLAEALVPSADEVIVRRGLDETDQARAMLQERPGVGIGAAHDIDPWVGRAVRGGRLDPAQFLGIAETLDSAARLGAALAEERRALLRDLGRRLHPLPALRSTLLRSFDPAGELLDTASPRLGGLRGAVRVAYDRLRRRLDSLVGSELGGALQEPLITMRNGRYVVPVRADARSRVKGIVHDASGSGQTLFVEPLVVVELGNAWREAQAAVDEEEGRILDELSALVGANGTLLRETLEALAQFDFWAAKAQLAAELDGVRPEATERTEVVLLSARHPGLTGRVVPIDLRLGEGYTALVITGPNTGGKTVALRTLGLLALMHQSGLHVPAETGSRLPVFRDVFADIGDEQSIAQSLSTFSGHLRSITRIVASAGPETLVLLDELGAGTDPTEGSALAQALLDHFIRSGALVAATTHYAEIKVYAHETPEARNASVEFDLETLSPTYPAHHRAPGRLAGLRDRRAAGTAGHDRRRRAQPPVREPARLRGDARVDPPPGGRDRRGRRSGPSRRGQGNRGAAVGGRGAAAGPTRARRSRASCPRRGPAAGGRPQGRRGGRAPAPGARDRDGAGHRCRARACRADARAPPRGAQGTPAHRAGGSAHLARWRARPQPERRLGGTHRGPGEGRHAGDPRGGGHARIGRGGRPRARGRDRGEWGSGDRIGGRPGPRHAARCRRGARQGSPACGSGAPAAWPRRWTCAGRAWTRRSKRWRATWTTRRWRGSSR